MNRYEKIVCLNKNNKVHWIQTEMIPKMVAWHDMVACHECGNIFKSVRLILICWCLQKPLFTSLLAPFYFSAYPKHIFNGMQKSRFHACKITCFKLFRPKMRKWHAFYTSVFTMHHKRTPEHWYVVELTTMTTLVMQMMMATCITWNIE